jgi:hypothetical protein
MIPNILSKEALAKREEILKMTLYHMKDKEPLLLALIGIPSDIVAAALKDMSDEQLEGVAALLKFAAVEILTEQAKRETAEKG